MVEQPSLVHLPAEMITTALATVLRGGPLDASGLAPAADIVDVAIAQGIAPLLEHSPAAAAIGGDAAARLSAHARSQQLLTTIRDAELQRVVALLHDGGVAALVIKGAHLARAIYPAPQLRPRSDSDLLVSYEDTPGVRQVLLAAGYSPLVHVRGSVILGQFHFHRTDEFGVAHALDVHWRVAAPLVFDTPALSLERLSVASEIVHGLAPARGPSLAHALLIAGVHLVAHHRADATLLWLYDLYLLARALDDAGRTAFIDAAVAAGVTAVCARALERAGMDLPDPSLDTLARQLRALARDHKELSARLLTSRNRIDDLWLDVIAARGWRTRVTLLREHTFPEAVYVRERKGSSRLLPLAYASRALRGMRRWMASNAADR